MKNYLISSLMVVLFICPILKIYAQPIKAPIFGKDIIIHEQLNKDQQDVAICSAFNGWMYNTLSYDSLSHRNILVTRSTDFGITWEPIAYIPFAALPSEILRRVDVATLGLTLDSLKIFVGFCYQNPISKMSGASLLRINGVTGVIEDSRLLYENNDGITDFDLCSDANFLPIGSNSGTLAIIYARRDSVSVRTSSNGGISLDGWRKITNYYPDHVGRVGIAYGISPIQNTGRYFAVWENKEHLTSPMGHIFYSHSEPNFNSPFIAPQCIDSIDPMTNNLGCNPQIACQYGNMNNDSLNLTTLIIFETENQIVNGNGLKGYFNKTSTQSTEFIPFDFSNPAHDNRMSAITFNPYDSTFVITWFDKTLQLLPCVSNTLNLTNPNEWMNLSAGYNDQQIDESPNPQCTTNPAKQSAAMTWIGNPTQANHQALFDAAFSTYTSTDQKFNTFLTNPIKAFPNPCDASTVIQFTSKEEGIGKLFIYNSSGQIALSKNQFSHNSSTNNYLINTSNFPSGIYMCELVMDQCVLTGRFIVIH